MFIAGFIAGGVVIGTLVAALFLSCGLQTDRVRSQMDEIATSEADSSGVGGDDG